MTIDCDKEYFQINTGTWKEKICTSYTGRLMPHEWQKRLRMRLRCYLDFLSTPLTGLL